MKILANAVNKDLRNLFPCVGVRIKASESCSGIIDVPIAGQVGAKVAIIGKSATHWAT
jgi:hypothetical protein